MINILAKWLTHIVQIDGDWAGGVMLNITLDKPVWAASSPHDLQLLNTDCQLTLYRDTPVIFTWVATRATSHNAEVEVYSEIWRIYNWR